LNAYRSRQLSVEELNRIWQHAQVMVEPAPSQATVPPLAWELRVREARRQYEQAEAESARVQEEARLKTVTATILAEKARAAEAQLVAALHSANTGLVGLLRATWADERSPGWRVSRSRPASRPAWTAPWSFSSSTDHQPPG
jgi:hypothetical protein